MLFTINVIPEQFTMNFDKKIHTFSLIFSADPRESSSLKTLELTSQVTNILEHSQEDDFHHLAAERSRVLSCIHTESMLFMWRTVYCHVVPIEGFCCTTTEGALNVVCGFKEKIIRWEKRLVWQTLVWFLITVILILCGHAYGLPACLGTRFSHLASIML